MFFDIVYICHIFSIIEKSSCVKYFYAVNQNNNAKKYVNMLTSRGGVTIVEYIQKIHKLNYFIYRLLKRVCDKIIV